MPVIEIECGVLERWHIDYKTSGSYCYKLKTVAPFQDLQGHLYWSKCSIWLEVGLGVWLGLRDSSK